MNNRSHVLDLSGLDGSNPLGFLAALGTVVVLSESDPAVLLGWKRTARWIPFLQSCRSLDKSSVASILAEKLRGKPVGSANDGKRARSQIRFDATKKKLKDARAQLKALRLRGKERQKEHGRIVAPLEQKLEQRRSVFLERLRAAVPSPELAIGQRPDCTIEEFRGHAAAFLDTTQPTSRTAIDLLAAFGTETGGDADERIKSTPFCFITGSGHQWFLDTVRQLVAQASPGKVREALFDPWTYGDEKLTMRWDPVDDRRYALLDRDPTASNNKSRTVWMANLLAYRALVFYPCVSVGAQRNAAGWTSRGQSEAFTWPIWESPLAADTIRSLLCHPAFGEADLTHIRYELRARGVATLFRSRRVQVGKPPLHKINFGPAQSV